MSKSDQQLSMWENGERVAGVQNKVAGSGFAQDQQPTREIGWHEEGYAVIRWVAKPDTGFKEAKGEGGKTVVVREQVLEVVEVYELDEMSGRTLVEEGHAAAQAVIAERYKLEPSADALAS